MNTYNNVEIICQGDESLSKEESNFLDEHYYTLEMDTHKVLKYTTNEKIPHMGKDAPYKTYYISVKVDKDNSGSIKTLTTGEILSNEAKYYPCEFVTIENASVKTNDKHKISCHLNEYTEIYNKSIHGSFNDVDPTSSHLGLMLLVNMFI